MTELSRICQFPRIALLAMFLAAAGCASSSHSPAPSTLASADSLCPGAAALEAKTVAISPKCVASTVGLVIDGDDPGVGSGVVVSADGLILTAAHVVVKPGIPMLVYFPDGREVHGITLGENHEAQTGMARITDTAPAGGWPFSPVAPADSLKLGDWLLATGHAGSIVIGRNPPVRLGRVTSLDEVSIQTDCTIEPGDSGGPLFNLAGQVVGIGNSIAVGNGQQPIPDNLTYHVPIGLFAAQWNDLLAGKTFHPEAATQSDNTDPQPGAATQPSDAATQPSDAPAQADDDAPVSRQVKESGKTSLQALGLVQPALQAAGECVVEIHRRDKMILMGTIVDPDGWIVTKASDLKGMPTVVLADGSEVDVQFAGMDTVSDLALLKIEADGLKAVKFADGADLGAWLVSPTHDPNLPAISVVSVAAREIPKLFSHRLGQAKMKLGLQLDEDDCEVIAITPGMPAEAAGLKVGDTILAINGKSVEDTSDFVDRVMKCKTGDTLVFKVHREDKDLEIKAILGEEKLVTQTDDGIGEEDEVANGKLSKRRSDFPQAIQHDGAVWADECGGPLLNLRGQAVGINIARYDRTCTFAIPAATVVKTVAELRTAFAKSPPPPLVDPNELKIGDAAPALVPSKWIKGEPVTKFETGKIYVVEFWATWCAPCKESIPHITSLQKQYPDVTFIGMDCMEQDQSLAPAFVKEMGDKMSYRVALDDAKNSMATAWLDAAYQDGIPCAFVVDKDSKIAWIGHPMDLDDVIKQIKAGTFDPKKAAEEQE